MIDYGNKWFLQTSLPSRSFPPLPSPTELWFVENPLRIWHFCFEWSHQKGYVSSYMLIKLELKKAKEKWVYYIGAIFYGGKDRNVIISCIVKIDKCITVTWMVITWQIFNTLPWLPHLNSARVIIKYLSLMSQTAGWFNQCAP